MKLADLIPDGILGDKDDAVGLLQAEHEELRALFERFDALKAEGSPADKEAVVAETCGLLLRHMRMEEDVFYPAVRDEIDDEDLVNEALVEHDSSRSLIEELERMDGDDAMFNAKFKVLAELTEHHLEEEDDELFPKVRASEVDLKALAAEMRDYRDGLSRTNRHHEKKIPAIRQRLSRSDRQRPFPVG